MPIITAVSSPTTALITSTSDASGNISFVTAGSTAMTLDTNQNAVHTGYVSMPNTFGFKNRIINGAMQIAQYGTSSTPTSSGTFTCDRFILFATSGTAAVTQSTNAPAGFTNSILWTQTSGGTRNSGDYFEIGQRIEGYNIADLGWGTSSAKTVTLSFWVQSSITGTYALALQSSASSGSTYVTTYTINAANTWQQIILTIPGATSGTWNTNNAKGITVWWDLGSGSTYQTSTLNTWQYSSANPLTTSTQVNFGQTSGATFYITGVQLESGSKATPFDMRDYGRELIMCQRYYEIGGNDYGTIWSGNTTSGNAYYVSAVFKVTKRAGATIVATNMAYSGFNGTYSVGGSSITTAAQLTETATSSVNGGYFVLSWTASAEL